MECHIFILYSTLPPRSSGKYIWLFLGVPPTLWWPCLTVERYHVWLWKSDMTNHQDGLVWRQTTQTLELHFCKKQMSQTDWQSLWLLKTKQKNPLHLLMTILYELQLFSCLFKQLPAEWRSITARKGEVELHWTVRTCVQENLHCTAMLGNRAFFPGEHSALLPLSSSTFWEFRHPFPSRKKAMGSNIVKQPYKQPQMGQLTD